MSTQEHKNIRRHEYMRNVVHIYIYTYIFVYVCIYIYSLCSYIYVCMYVYIYTPDKTRAQDFLSTRGLASGYEPRPALGVEVSFDSGGLGFRARGLGLRVQSLGFRAYKV